MKKRIISLLVLCCLALLLVPGLAMNAEAAASYTSGDWTYEVNSGLATITKYSGTAATVDIPQKFGNYQVTAIGKYAFADNATMETVNFPSSITSIGLYAFSGCVGLRSITLPERLDTLGGYAFRNCTNVTQITVASKKLNDIFQNYDPVGTVDDRWGEPFYNVGIATDGVSVVFTDTCTVIPARLFHAQSGTSCAANIISVEIPDSVLVIGQDAFAQCGNLRRVNTGNGVQTIHDYAFFNCTSLNEVILSRNLTAIGVGAFENCTSLTEIVFPESLISIGNWAFRGCVSLGSIVLPERLDTLGGFSFQNCTAVTRITVKSNKINDTFQNYDPVGTRDDRWGEPFKNVGRATDGVAVIFTDTCTGIPARLFHAQTGEAYAANITSVEIADSVQKIGQDAFSGCAELTCVDMGSGIKAIDDYAFYNCTGLSTVKVSDALEVIGNGAFENCASLAAISLPENLTSIGTWAFKGCIALKSITLPERLATLGGFSFENCTALSRITIASQKLNDIFQNRDAVGTRDDRWGEPFRNAGTDTSGIAVVFTDTCTAIPARLFDAQSGQAYCAKITSVLIPATVTKIGEYAFANCTALESVKFMGEAPEIKGNAFAGTATTAYYPTGFDTWTEDKLQNYGGTITWKSFLSRLSNVTVYKTNPHATGNILYWNAVDGGDVYQVYRLNPGATSWTLITNTRSLAYKDTSAAGGVKYYYKIVVRNGDVKSNIATTTSVAVTRPATDTLPDVQMIGVTPHSTGNIVKWNAVSGAKLYQVYRLKSGSTSWELLTNTGSLAYKDQMAPVGVRCYYKCVARNGDAKSNIATTASVSGVRPTPTSLNNVEMISAQGHSTGIIVKWNPVGGAQLYQVYRLKSGTTTWELITNTGSTGYKDTTAVSGVRYYYKVVARSGNIKSGMNIDSVSAVCP